jgi:hypothetical protein
VGATTIAAIHVSRENRAGSFSSGQSASRLQMPVGEDQGSQGARMSKGRSTFMKLSRPAIAQWNLTVERELARIGSLVGPGTAAIATALANTFSFDKRVRMRFEWTFTNLPEPPELCSTGYRRYIAFHIRQADERPNARMRAIARGGIAHRVLSQKTHHF